MTPTWNNWIELNHYRLTTVLEELRTSLQPRARQDGHDTPVARRKSSRVRCQDEPALAVPHRWCGKPVDDQPNTTDHDGSTYA
jgi:hypothetical protein